MTNTDTPRASDDREAAERKSLSVDERVPDRQGPDAVPATQLPGAFGAALPQQGIGARGPLDGGDRGPGEAALDHERKAQETPTRHG